jgi:hypothetical protein
MPVLTRGNPIAEMPFEGMGGVGISQDDIHAAVIRRNQAIGRDDESAHHLTRDHRQEDIEQSAFPMILHQPAFIFALSVGRLKHAEPGQIEGFEDVAILLQPVPNPCDRRPLRNQMINHRVLPRQEYIPIRLVIRVTLSIGQAVNPHPALGQTAFEFIVDRRCFRKAALPLFHEEDAIWAKVVAHFFDIWMAPAPKASISNLLLY